MKEMRSEKLQDAIGEIDSVYIEDAHKEHSAPKPAVRLNIARYVAAACMLLLVAGGVILFAKTADDHTSTTDSEEEKLTVNDVNISVLPIWKWLLKENS